MTRPRYYAVRSTRFPNSCEIRRDSLLGNSGFAEDIVRARCAEHYVRLLNKGLANVQSHLPLGTRIVPVVEARALRERIVQSAPMPPCWDMPDPLHL